jgi:two-component system, LytTR family, sensor kinase
MIKMNIHYSNKGIRIISHSLFWIIYIIFFYLQYVFYSKDVDSMSILSSLLLTAVVDIFAAYFTVYYLLPEYLFKKKYIAFAVLFLISAAIAILVQRVLLYYIAIPYFYGESVSHTKSFWHINPFYSFFNIYTVVSLFAVIKLMKYWYRNQHLKTELEKKNQTSELALLRTQLNPHFLFNTLNNIDALISSDQNKASDAVIKLSEIMRFTLYEASNDRVPLEREINYLENYISLQQLRLKNPYFVKFENTTDCKGMTIAPMLFIPFVENAFKHGLKNVVAPGIEITLNCENDVLTFEVINRYSNLEEQNKDATSGIGLANTRKRLNLLYPEKHKLEIRKSTGIFKVNLSIFP